MDTDKEKQRYERLAGMGRDISGEQFMQKCDMARNAETHEWNEFMRIRQSVKPKPSPPHNGQGNQILTALQGLNEKVQSIGERLKNPKSPKLPRARGITNEWIAQQFNNYALPLIAKCYPINKDEDYIRRDIIPTLQKQGRKFAMNNEYGGLCVYEPMRGGNKSGYATVGNITANGIKKWIGKYRDESNPEPKSGFHAGMLKDKTSIEEAARKWGNYWRGYALAFFEWRKTHTGTPRNQFRYSPSPVIHGAEHTAASVPQS